MEITNSSNFIFDYYIEKRYIKLLPKEKRDFDFRLAKILLERFVYGGMKMRKEDIAYIEKTKNDVIFHLKNGKTITQSKPEELRFRAIMKQMDESKYQVAIFVKNIITHYSGGRYWAWLLGHILAEDDVQVTFITNQKPPFGKSFECYNLKDVFVYEDDPKNLYKMGNRIAKNVFDCVVGIPIEGGISAQVYAEKWAISYYCLIFETPNFTRDYRTGNDTVDAHFTPYVSPMTAAKKVINNTEIGKDYLDKWDKMPGGFDKKKSVWLWNSINTKVCDLVKQKEHNKKGEYHVVFVGRLLNFKRILHIVRTLNLLKDTKFVLHLISGSAGSMVEKMKDECHENIAIEYHSRVDDYEKYQIIKLCNMMIFLSSFEGFGMPPMEALYAERVCVSYPLPILKLIYKDHLVYAKDGDVKDLSGKIAEWLPESKKKTEHIKKAKEYIDGIASHERVRREFFEIVEKGKVEKKVKEKKKFDASILERAKSLTFGIIICNGSQFVIQNLKHIYNIADEIVICEGAVDLFDKVIGSFYSTDKTLEMIREFKANNDPEKKIRIITAQTLGRAWRDKMEMQNAIAEHTHGEVFVKQDIDEFYDLNGLLSEVDRMNKDAGMLMINYQSYHFWGDLKHIVRGANFNDKQTRVWKWKKTYRYLKTFNWISDSATGQHLPPRPENRLVSEDTLFHYSYLYSNRARFDILNYYKMRGLGDHKDVAKAWVEKNPSFLEGGRQVKAIDLKHPVDEKILQEFVK